MQFPNIFLKLFVAIMACGAVVSAQNIDSRIFSYSPAKPRPGDQITIQYHPGGSVLDRNMQYTALICSYSDELLKLFNDPDLDILKSIELPMERKGSMWTVSFPASHAARGLVIAFRNGDLIDNNSQTGYVIPLFDEDGKIVPGHFAELSGAYISWGYKLALKMDYSLALRTFENEFMSHPELKAEYINPYLLGLMRVKGPVLKELLSKELDELEKKKELSSAEIQALVMICKFLNTPDKAKKYMDDLGFISQPELSPALKRLTEIEYATENRIQLLKKFKEDFPDSKEIAKADMILFREYLKEKDYSRLNEQIKVTLASNRAIFWWLPSTLLKNLIEAGSPQSLEIAEKVVKDAMKKYRDLQGKTYVPGDFWEWNFLSGMGDASYKIQLLTSYGKILLKQNKNDEALKVLEEVREMTQGRDSSVNLVYAEALIGRGDTEKGRGILEQMKGMIIPPIREAWNNLYIDVLLKSQDNEKALAELEAMIKPGAGAVKIATAYEETGGSIKKALAAYEEIYLRDHKDLGELKKKTAEFDVIRKKLIRAELMKAIKLINDAPAELSIEDMDGRTLSLNDLKGKIVVLDFWGIHCGPCVAALPAWFKVCEIYKDDKDVKIIFINTQDAEKNIKDYFAKWRAAKKMSFDTYFDMNDKTYADYGLSGGIPWKVVIDKNGKIRFREMGFNGSVEETIEELCAVIEMARAGLPALPSLMNGEGRIQQ